jgi:hypothetical protein
VLTEDIFTNVVANRAQSRAKMVVVVDVQPPQKGGRDKVVWKVVPKVQQHARAEMQSLRPVWSWIRLGRVRESKEVDQDARYAMMGLVLVRWRRRCRPWGRDRCRRSGSTLRTTVH